MKSIIAAIVFGGMLLSATSSCTGEASDDFPHPMPTLEELPYDTLSEYGFFRGVISDLRPAPGVTPYTVASPLWSDLAGKGRFIVLPYGEQATFDDGEDWEFPLGTIIIKTFFFQLDRRQTEEPDARVVETRLLVRYEEGWVGHTYVWNEQQTEAELRIAGGRLNIEFTDDRGERQSQVYQVPNDNECGHCHERDDEMRLLGLVTPQVNRDIDLDGGVINQLQWLIDQGVFENPPADVGAFDALVDPFGDAPLEARARDYLHANCSHCHREGGGGDAPA